MSRSGYYDDYQDNWSLICWRGAVMSAIKGKRGQALLHEIAELMDAMPEKKLARGVFESAGEFCALGVVGHARGIDMSKFQVEGEDWRPIADAFNISEALAREIMFVNDDDYCWRGEEDQAVRWKRMRKWVAEHIKEKKT